MRGRRLRGAGCASAVLFGLGIACSGSSGSSSAPPNILATPADNVAQVFVDYGPLNAGGYTNGLFATVNVCVPGSTTDCQAIDNVLVDTGSTGLRLLGSVLTLSLPALTDSNGVVLAECGQFLGGFIWGPLQSADLRIAGEQASGLAIQVIDESTYPVPSDCTGFDSSSADTLGANGLLGVSSLLQDCGSACAARLGARSENPGLYYACSSATAGGCQAAAVPVTKQLSNPVSFFSQDNNGTIIELPAIPADGAPSVAGSLVFGIGTRENNGLGPATAMRLDSSGFLSTSYPPNGSAVLAFIDSGSNVISFLDSATTHIPTCFDPQYPSFSDFYCPSSTQNLSARLHDAYGSVALDVSFSIANAEALFAHPYNVAFSNLGGPSTDPQSGNTTLPAYFDWGLPFHFGRNVFTAIEGQATPAGAGPFVAF
jgi:hypothetical protein